MTASRDPDRILRAWLDLMPDEAPERVVDTVLDQIDHTPQDRRPWAAGRWRSFPMPRFLLAGAAVVLAVLVGAIALQPRSAPSVASSPVPPPVGASAAPALGAVPKSLQHRWMGGPDPLVTAGAGTSIAFGSSNVSLSQSNADDVIFLTADVSAPVAGRLELRTGGSYGLCSADSVGSYQWTLSSSARVLTLSAVDDACPQRSGAMAGTWWLVGCKDPGDNCLGDLEAGTYSSQFINFAKPTVPAWVADFGAVTYTVPDGWANDADWPARLGLSPKDSYANWTPNVGTDRGIDVLADVHVSSNEARPCSGSPLASAGSDPGRIVGSIRGIRGLQATAPSPVTIDGRPGVQVDLSVDDQKLVPCGSDRVVEFLVSGGEGMAIGPGERIRLIVLSDGERAIAIQILAPASAFDAVVAQSMPIVQSMHFK